MVVDLKHLFSNLAKQKRNCLTVSRIHYSVMQQCCAATCHTWKTKIMKSIMMMLGRMHALRVLPSCRCTAAVNSRYKIEIMPFFLHPQY